MENFNKQNVENLKTFLFSSYVHDSKIEFVLYSRNSMTLKIKNEHYKVEYVFVFSTMEGAVFQKGNEDRCVDTIYSLTVEDNFAPLFTVLPMATKTKDGLLYVLVEMLSGNQLHIIFNDVRISTILSSK